MYVVTNRHVDESTTGVAQFAGRPNAKGNNELRLVEVNKHGPGWSVQFVDDQLSQVEVDNLIREFHLPIDRDAPQYGSLKAACEIFRRIRDDKRHQLLFVHGYNNELRDVLEAAHQLQQRYGVEVLAFSWPALGGGLEGTLNYKADKRQARASAGALERAIKIMHERLELITRSDRERLRQKAKKEHPDNPEAREAYYTQLVDKQCPFTINAMYHSMGNYLLKHMLKSTANEGNPLLFDNVVLCQADTNHLDHEDWVDTIRFRKRLFITINEDDRALNASRLKLGSDQLAASATMPRISRAATPTTSTSPTPLT